MSSRSRIQRILREAAVSHGVSVDDIWGKSQGKTQVQARRDAARKLRSLGLSLPRIGLVLGRHHSTVYSLIKHGGWIQNSIQEQIAETRDIPDESGVWAI